MATPKKTKAISGASRGLDDSMGMWFLFALFAISLALLSYGHLRLVTAMEVFFFGLLLPAGVFLFLKNGAGKKDSRFSGEKEVFAPPSWAWGAVLILAVWVRLYRLTTLSSWPILDDGTTGYLGSEIARGVEVPWYFEFNHSPMFYQYGFALFLKMFGASLQTLWLYPALWSVASVFLLWRAALRLGDNVFAFLLTAIWAVSFPILYTGRFATPQVLLMFGVVLAFYFWVRWRQAKDGSAIVWVAALGLTAGLGFHVYISWAVIAVLIVVAFHFGAGTQKITNAQKVAFWIPFLGLALPTILFVVKNPNSYLLKTLEPGEMGGWERWRIFFSYFTVHFWGADTPLFAYKPFWGGYLNPVAGSFLFVGALALWKNAPRKAGMAGLAFLVLLSPGLVTNHAEYFRTAPVFPLLVFGAAYGLRRLLGSWNRRKFLIALLLIAASHALDFYHLTNRYVLLQPKNPQFRLAYDLILERARKEGRGYLFTDFLMNPMNRTLWFATLPFNALEAENASSASSRWAALVVNIHLAPFLEKRFPGATWVELPKEVQTNNGGLALVFLSIKGVVPVPLDRWRAAHETFEDVTAKVVHSELINASDEPLRNILLRDRKLFEGDRFLESVYWSRLMLSWGIDKKYAEALEASANALKYGYPTAAIYNATGITQLMVGNAEGARSSFRRAGAAPGNRTNAAENLERLK